MISIVTVCLSINWRASSKSMYSVRESGLEYSALRSSTISVMQFLMSLDADIMKASTPSIRLKDADVLAGVLARFLISNLDSYIAALRDASLDGTTKPTILW